MKPLELEGCVTQGTPASWATLSACGKYRYALGRAWDPEPEPDDVWPVTRAVFSIVMLNPSTANHDVDDQTIRKCIHFAKQEGCGQLLVRNLFAYRATDPKELLKVTDPVGPLNEMVLTLNPILAMRVAAWGQLSTKRIRSLSQRTRSVAGMRCNFVMALTEHGYERYSHFADRNSRQPRHPLYLPNATRAVLWREASKL
jgi:hypothetical protein